MTYSLCLLPQTPDFMDNAGLLQIQSWAQDSWKETCSNKL